MVGKFFIDGFIRLICRLVFDQLLEEAITVFLMGDSQFTGSVKTCFVGRLSKQTQHSIASSVKLFRRFVLIKQELEKVVKFITAPSRPTKIISRTTG